MGTPVYMPPEQATGQIGAIDQRSDVYSLGAILYEMLTLEPPIDKEGGYLAVLMRVAEGEIVPPEQRSPQRARAGKIPKELAAVAQKAMAKSPQDRYQDVEALRNDIERFQEGRSVSAKEDTKTEMLVKFVKRNKGFSAGVAVALLILVASLGFVTNAWWETGQAKAASDLAQKETKQRTEKAVPALVGAARMYGDNRNPDDALTQLDLALTYKRDYPPAHLLKGQVLIAKRDFPNAQSELEEYLKLQPQDREAKELAKLCQDVRPEDGERLLALADMLLQQKALGLSDYLMVEVNRMTGSSEKLLPVLRKRIEAAWPGLGGRLSVQKGGSLLLNLDQCGRQVRDLTPLKGMPLTWLSLFGCEQVRDLTPLKGMPLTVLSLYRCVQVRDLTPIQGMKLTSLDLENLGQVQDLSPLKGMPLTWLNLGNCVQVGDLTPLKGMPLSSLRLVNCVQVRDLTPLKDMPLTWLDMTGHSQVRDLTPLQGMNLAEIHSGPRTSPKAWTCFAA